MDNAHRHRTQSAVLNRLRRAHGHLADVIETIAAGEPCLPVAQQLQAVESAVADAKTTLIEDHLDHCLVAAVGPMDPEQRHGIEEFKKIAKSL